MMMQVGQDRLSAAFTEMMNSEDGRASDLLDQAMDKFEVRWRSRGRGGLAAVGGGPGGGGGSAGVGAVLLLLESLCAGGSSLESFCVVGTDGVPPPPPSRHTASPCAAPPVRCPPLPRLPQCRCLQDQVCYGRYNQATVHQYRVEFAMYKALREGKGAADIAEVAAALIQVGTCTCTCTCACACAPSCTCMYLHLGRLGPGQAGPGGARLGGQGGTCAAPPPFLLPWTHGPTHLLTCPFCT